MQSTGYFATIYRFGVLICGPKNRVFDIKSGHDFCRYRNSIQVIYFQINGGTAENKERFETKRYFMHKFQIDALYLSLTILQTRLKGQQLNCLYQW